jgi:hypothetical protein
MHHRVVRKGLEGPQRVEEIRGAASHEVRTPGTADEEGVSRKQMAVHEDRERVGRVARGVHDGHGLRADREGRAARDPPRRPLELRGRVRQHGGTGPLGEPANPREVVGVRVGIEHVSEADVAGPQSLQDLVDLVQARVDHQGAATRLVHHEVGQAAVSLGAERFESERAGITGSDRRHVRSPLQNYITIWACCPAGRRRTA